MLKVALFAQAVDTETSSAALPWYAYLFWACVLGSIGYWVYRGYTRVTRRKHDGPQVVRAESDPVPGGDRLRPPPAADRPEPPPASPAVPTPASTPPDTATPEPPVDRAVERDRATGSTPPPSGRSGLFAPAQASKAAGQVRPTDQVRPTVAKLLKGITMPCDLAPLVTSDGRAGATVGLEVTFATSGVDAAEVGRSVGDELERLGFSLESVSDAEVQADRDDGRLRVTLITDPSERKRDGIRVYPSLPPDSIVVEFESI